EPRGCGSADWENADHRGITHSYGSDWLLYQGSNQAFASFLSRPEIPSKQPSCSSSPLQVARQEFQTSVVSWDIDTAAKFIGAGAATVGVAGSGAGTVYRCPSSTCSTRSTVPDAPDAPDAPPLGHRMLQQDTESGNLWQNKTRAAPVRSPLSKHLPSFSKGLDTCSSDAELGHCLPSLLPCLPILPVH
uniref:Uncharacterized protein n=1 Tax=Canis lupus familiaris TaxID=9615 RepID=A0A8C0S700_CANLF